MRSLNMLSFVIPCHNEAHQIGAVIEGIHRELKHNSLDYEIIVMDNNSTDDTADLARAAGATVHQSAATTVAQVRNDAMEHVKGSAIVFLDGDVLLEHPWGIEIENVVSTLESNPTLITGSHCSAPDDLKNPLRTWYSAIENNSRDTHLGTGHMIMRRDFFIRVGMFNGLLPSGEDYEFCMRAKSMGGEILHNPRLVACHLGYPTSLTDFIKREAWHGLSDFMNAGAILGSKVALLTIAFIVLHSGLAFALLVRSPYICAASIASLCLLILGATIYKFGPSHINTILRRSLVMYLYFIGRSWAAMRALQNRTISSDSAAKQAGTRS